MIARRLFWAGALALLAGLVGCTTTSTYGPEHLASERENTVTVHAKDGSLIRFSPGEYEVGEDSLSGIGEVVTNSVNGATAPWMGSIAFDEIDAFTISRLNILGNVVIVGAVGLGAWTLTHLSPVDGWH